MTASDLVTALEPVAAAFEALGIAYFLGGSVASSAHGVARASLDADIVAEIEPAHVDRLAQQFAVAYYTPVVGVLKVATDVDRVYLRRWAAALGVDDLLDQALAAARA